MNFLSFIIALFASILDYSYAVYKKEKKLTKFAYLYAIIIFLITCFGSIRLLFPDRGERFNVVSALGVSPRLYYEGKDPGLPVSEYIDYKQTTIMKANNTDAKLIVYSEDGFLVNATNRNEILNKNAKLAEKYNIFVVLTLDCKYENFLKNETILISNKGEVLYNYEKNHLIPSMENIFYSNMTDFKAFNTGIGNLGLIICYDLDFPYYSNQLSRLGLDTLLVPYLDWDFIEFHSIELRFRAIENGFNTVKSTGNGITLTNDYKGRFLSYYQPNICEDYFVLSTLYKKGKELYIHILVNISIIYI